MGSQQAAHGTTQFTLRTYLTGFFVAVVLTAIPFWVVMARPIDSALVSAVVVVILAVAQIYVHTFAFLHVNTREQGGWTLIAYVFTTVLVLITIAGSLWIMMHLNSNMMPGMRSDPETTSQMP